MKPIIIFESEQQALECLREWKERLNLFDWIINIHLHFNHPCIAPAWGSSSIWRAIHTAEINIPMPSDGQINKFPQRYIQELILVHELLHICLPTVEVEVETTEGEYYEAETHARLELLAKALISAKYNLTFDYFENF